MLQICYIVSDQSVKLKFNYILYCTNFYKVGLIEPINLLKLHCNILCYKNFT